MPLNHDGLRKSREERARIKQKYGEIPTSIWLANYGENKTILDETESQCDKVMKREEAAEKSGKHHQLEQREKGFPSLMESRSLSGRSIRGKSGGVSRYPANICKRIVLHYSEPGEIIYDPCAGHNSRMQVVWELDRSYIGYDISQDYINFNNQVAKRLMGEVENSQSWLEGFRPQSKVELYCRDNRNCHLTDNSIDLTFTSPPYWDLEFYGGEPEQLGWGKSYPEFLEGIKQMMAEQYRVLKSGRFCALSVNDFRKEGRYYPFHADIIRLGNEVNFQLFDLIIMVWPSSIRAAFASQIETTKIMPKRHEYLVVFRKGGGSGAQIANDNQTIIIPTAPPQLEMNDF